MAHGYDEELSRLLRKGPVAATASQANMTTTTRSAAKNQSASAGAPPAEEAQPGSKHKTSEGAGSPRPKRSRKAEEKESRPAEETARGGEKLEDSDEASKKESQHAKDDRPVSTEKKDDSTAVQPQGRDEPEALPSSILEKGIIYFFFRGRVGIDEPSSVDDIARSYIVLRPIEKDAKLSSGPIGDAGNTRLCVIPKKVLPQSGRDRWTAFVEKSGASFQQLKDEFLASSEYETKTAGTRHTPAATPIGEGVYAITSTGRESHLAYILTLPEELGEVQREIGLKEKGSFIITTKNPQYPGPANARLPKPPEYPKEMLEEFRSLRWVPTQPKHLDFVNTQFLLIGESSGIEKALEPPEGDKKQKKEEPAEEMEMLEEEDTQRMQGLSENDSDRVFADLQVHATDYPKLQTTF